jgi:hypothetical protein
MHLYLKISQFLRRVYKKVPPSFCILDSFLPRVIVCYPRDFAPHIENASIDFNLLFQSARFFASIEGNLLEAKCKIFAICSYIVK